MMYLKHAWFEILSFYLLCIQIELYLHCLGVSYAIIRLELHSVNDIMQTSLKNCSKNGGSKVMLLSISAGKDKKLL